MRSRFLSLDKQFQEFQKISMSKERKELIVSFVAAIVLGYILTTILHSRMITRLRRELLFICDIV